MDKYVRMAEAKFGASLRPGSSLSDQIFNCPKCNRPKLHVDTDNGVFHCFRCDYKGKLKGKTNLSTLREKYNMQGLREASGVANKDRQLTLIPYRRAPLTEQQRQKLYDRGLTDDDIDFYKISGSIRNERIQIPNFVKGMLTDVIVAWEWDKSKVTSDNPKYLNSEGTKKSRTLFNYFNIPDEPEQIVLCEGVFNAITAGRNAVASYGCAISERQVEMLIEKKPKSILIAYDSDEPGVNGSVNAIKMLADQCYTGLVEYILLPKGIDVNDLGRENFWNYCNNNKVKIHLQSPMGIKLPKLLYKSRV